MAQAKKKKADTAGKIQKNGRSLRLAKTIEGKDFSKVYNLKDAIKLVKETATAKFKESMDIAVALGIDVKQTDQNVRGVVSLPNGTGKTVRVAVFARDAKADAAKKAGATVVGAEELIDEVAKGNINFDRCIATPDMMPLLGKIAKVLGPKGLMPNPKLGSVTENVAEAVKSALAGQVEFRADKGGIVHAIIGKVDFDENALAQNIKVFIEALEKAKPQASKNTYIKKVVLSSTMGPSVKVNVNEAE